MMRALWTAGSGMKAQQFNVDVISNNLANVNTTGYKKERAEFKDLLYETMSRAYVLDSSGKPVNLQVGHGTAVNATVRNFESGNVDKTDSPLDFAIEGEGFFTILGSDSVIRYTRDGSFKISVTEDGMRKLTTSDGYSVLDDTEQEIVFDSDVDITSLIVDSQGQISYKNAEGETVAMGQNMGLVHFPNKYALEAVGKNLFERNSATGEPVQASQDTTGKSTISQYYLEASNVSVVDEMVKLIVAQRAYEVSSKAIQQSDDMLQIANNLKR
ncbi:flagellar basal-body rod protein FlgG [Ruminiclostridium hungatei]|uniref:Flagellar basal-body rod protein FlgG n=1 Tax=Ruminiclostridium hungatei TaxID=48256 RepID=A0A1V4SKP7_RUMHU|nr:flagellar basal-body rod protein FlgG [Ruminiclostridium hungatei]OPX43801.1 flagellar basal-body rod protein FlgG [Ruminiclostridium hungatei]